jgi:hypothetical protein
MTVLITGFNKTPDGHDFCLTNAADLVYKLYRIKLSGDLNG